MLDNFDDRYLGAKTSDPALDNDGNALVLGALYFNSTDGVMKVYTASGWIAASSASVATLATFEFVATAGQTVFTGNDANGVSLSYVAPAIIVTLNGVRLRPGDDYTATNGTSITLISAAALNDELVVDAFGSFLVANTYTIAEADALLVNKVSQTSSTGAANLPRGTTAQRPGSPIGGQMRFNTTNNTTEIYNGVDWTVVTSVPYTASYLIIGGGAAGGGTISGGSNAGGGGGAGGRLASTVQVSPGTTYSFLVGAGSAGVAGISSNGTSSSGFNLTALGGGYGGATNSANGNSGGSGGGGSSTGSAGAGGAGTSGQGSAGGDGNPNSPNYAGGGGGGAGGTGGTASSTTGGAGGSGSASSITGTSLNYAGGGGGATYGGGTAGGGGAGGGGAGASNTGVGTAGTANTGGGGGGSCLAGTANIVGANGGSGVIIISVPTANYSAITTGSPTITTSGANTIIKFTSSGTYTA